MKFKFIKSQETKPLKYPISFTVSLLGKEICAVVTGLVEHPILNVFAISICDGYSDKGSQKNIYELGLCQEPVPAKIGYDLIRHDSG